MAKTAVDLSKFKHVKSDEHSTTVEHEDGHEITFKHKHLPEEFVSSLKGMKKPESKDEKAPKKMADGGEVPGALAKDGPAYDPMQDPGVLAAGASTLSSTPQLTPKDAYNQQMIRQMTSNPGGSGFDPNELSSRLVGDDGKLPAHIDHKAASLAQDALEQNAAKLSKEDADSKSVSAQSDADAQALGLKQPPTLADAVTTAGAPDNAVVPAAQNQIPQQSGQSGSDPEALMMGGYHNAMAGIQADAAAKGALGDQQAKLLEHQQQIDNKLLGDFQNHYQALETERGAMIKDIQNGYVDPNKYWTGDANGNGGHSKIAAGIGMLLSGFNPTAGAANGAADMMQFQMQQNLAAQEKNLGSKQSLLSNNLAQFGNLKEATMATRIMQTDMLSHQIEAAAAKSASPLAKAAAQTAIGQLQMQIAPQVRQFAMMRMVNGLMQQPNGGAPAGASPTAAIERALPTMRMIMPEYAKSIEGKLVPGIGIAARDVPQEDRNKIVAHQDLERQMGQVLQFAKQHSGSLSPETRAQGATMMNALQDSLRRATGAGVYKESEAHFMSDTLGDNPAKFFSSLTTVPRVKQLLQLKNDEYSNLLRNYSLPAQHAQPATPQGSGTASQAMAWAKANPNDPRAAKIMKTLGGN